MLLGLAALVVSRLDEERKRLVAAFFAGTALLFVVGTIFTEYVPWKAMLQLQPHRSWRFCRSFFTGRSPRVSCVAGERVVEPASRP